MTYRSGCVLPLAQAAAGGISAADHQGAFLAPPCNSRALARSVFNSLSVLSLSYEFLLTMSC